MNNISASLALIVVGAAILVGSLLADVIGIGDDPGFGKQQMAGSILGVVVLALGAYFHNKKDASSSSDQG